MFYLHLALKMSLPLFEMIIKKWPLSQDKNSATVHRGGPATARGYLSTITVPQPIAGSYTPVGLKTKGTL